MDEVCSTCGGRGEVYTGFWWGILRDRYNLKEPGVDGRILQGGSNMTGTDLYVNKPHCAAAVRP